MIASPKTLPKTFVIGDVHGRRAQFKSLVEMLPRDDERDTLVILGDIVDRGEDAPGVVSDILELRREQPRRVVILRGNHEQMLLDFIDGRDDLWFHAAVGSEMTFEQYAGHPLNVAVRENYDVAQREVKNVVPPEHVEFFRGLPFYYEDDYALYVHAGLDCGKHPRDTDPHRLMWSRDEDFFRHYHGKLCVFGHTPVPFLPLLGRIGNHGIYVHHSAVGIDTGYTHASPLSCLELPDFNLYQAFEGGRTATYHIRALVSETLRYVHKRRGAPV